VDILQILRNDYQRFPKDQTYSIYAEDVYFKDPMTEFRGIARYQQMIGFIQSWFLDCHMKVHNLQQTGDTIRSDWTLSWRTPLPWKPAIAISGWSELTLDAAGRIAAHIDYWHCSKLDVVKQHVGFQPKPNYPLK
jgi:Uncharacterized conserved protein (DUF2358)